MRHVLLTCKQHPNLRWSCKEIAFTDEGGYNGARSIFFNGELLANGKCDENATECSCLAHYLIRAPEDKES